MEFLRADDGEFGKAVISPLILGRDYENKYQRELARDRLEKGTAVLLLDSPGTELTEAGVKGTMRKWVVTTKFTKEGPRDVRVQIREKIFGRDRVKKTKL